MGIVDSEASKEEERCPEEEKKDLLEADLLRFRSTILISTATGKLQ